MIRRRLRKTLQGQGRPSLERRDYRDRIRSIDAMAAYLGDKPFFMGKSPVGIDATSSPSQSVRSVRCSNWICGGRPQAMTICGGMSAG